MRILVMSFGFKYGLPRDADLVIDVRFLANPYYEPDLKILDGRQEPVRNFVMGHRNTLEFLDKFVDLIDFTVPLYEEEGRANLTIAIGCTGGRHRSVVISEFVFHHLFKPERSVELHHRDLDQHL